MTLIKKTSKVEVVKKQDIHFDVDAWESIRGMWKEKSVDAIAYQKSVRQESVKN